jgi:hypothetical protein
MSVVPVRPVAADYAALIPVYVPALDGTEDKLRTCARVADLGARSDVRPAQCRPRRDGGLRAGQGSAPLQ